MILGNGKCLCGCRCDHGAGVCCIQVSQVQDSLVYTGCYDEHIRAWDLRKLTCPVDQVLDAMCLPRTSSVLSLRAMHSVATRFECDLCAMSRSH